MFRPLSFLIQTRNYSNYAKGRPKFWKSNVKVYGKVNYYPRFPGHEDPPMDPTKLLVVNRVKPYKGNPYWEKAILDQLKIGEDSTLETIAIVKNTPEVCAQLWRVKHLIKVTPLHLPKQLPDDDDTRATWLHENGDLLVTPRVDPAREKATIEHMNNPKRLDMATLRHELRMRWLMPYDT